MKSGSATLILMYHRIDDAVSDPWSLCVGAGRFASHLAVLRQRGWHAMSLLSVCNALESRTLPNRSVVVTFDDGYADNLWQASPLLERYEVPATVFLVSGHLGGSPAAFWWDELERLILYPGRLPPVLRLRILDRTYQWELADSAEYSSRDTKTYRDWRAWHEPPTPRHRAYRELWETLQPLDRTVRGAVLDELARFSQPAGLQSAPRLLTADDVRTLARNEWISIGAHTVSHPTLAALSLAAQREEIAGSRTELGALLGTPVETFAFPFGADRNYSVDTVALVRDAGFRAACTTTARPVQLDADRFRLPRFQVENWTADEFERRLATWLDAAPSGPPTA